MNVSTRDGDRMVFQGDEGIRIEVTFSGGEGFSQTHLLMTFSVRHSFSLATFCIYMYPLPIPDYLYATGARKLMSSGSDTFGRPTSPKLFQLPAFCLISNLSFHFSLQTEKFNRIRNGEQT